MTESSDDDDWEAGGTDFSFDQSPDDPAARIDLSQIETATDESKGHLRIDTETVLATSFKRCRYQIVSYSPIAMAQLGPQPVCVRHSLPVNFVSGGQGRVVFLDGRPPKQEREDRVTHKLVRSPNIGTPSQISALFGPRGRPYGEGHVVLGNDKLIHELTPEAADFFLAAVVLLGEQYEGFFNGAAPGGPERLHAQYWHRKTPIFDCKMWPVSVERCAGSLVEVARWMVHQWEGHKNSCDFLFRSSGTDLRAVCIPRSPGRRRPTNNLFGNFGALEMAGYALAVGSYDAFQQLKEYPAFYEEALQQVGVA